MSTITLQVLQGLERGQLYADLPVPVTIGREEDNSLQLNDERISRCHVKIQQDNQRIILTDLQSTNGTRVNGLPVQMTVLRPGDLITLGRCVLLFGSREEIYKHCHELHRKSLEAHCVWETHCEGPSTPSEDAQAATQPLNTESLKLFDEHGQPIVPFPGGRPPLPGLSSLHTRSELADLISYIHTQILQVLETRDQIQAQNKAVPPSESARIPWMSWYQLLDLETDLAQYLKEIPEPD